MSRKVVAAVTDLFFVAKLRSAASHAGVNLAFASSVDQLLTRARDGAQLVVLDLNERNLDGVEALRALRSDPLTSGVATLAFYPHVQAKLAAEAIEAGCDQVVPRSRFSRDLVRLLGG
jgi:CheY-like chemotaxis protein